MGDSHSALCFASETSEVGTLHTICFGFLRRRIIFRNICSLALRPLLCDLASLREPYGCYGDL